MPHDALLPARHEGREDDGRRGPDVGPQQHGRPAPLGHDPTRGQRDNQAIMAEEPSGNGAHHADGHDAQGGQEAALGEL